MEKPKSSRIRRNSNCTTIRISNSPSCMPRFKGSAKKASSRRITPMSLLDRLREAVFRLIMYSAFSKAVREEQSRTADGGAKYYAGDVEYHSEAVADCIEFIKKSALSDDRSRDSSVSSYSSYSDVSSGYVMTG